MKKIITFDKDKRAYVAEDSWQVIQQPDEANCDELVSQSIGSKEPLIFPLNVLIHYADLFEQRDKTITGVWLAGDQDPLLLSDLLDRISLIAIHFPTFMDGRGYSIAHDVRKRLAWTGPLRALGDVLRDQLFYMKRCGFDEFALREDKNSEDALTAFDDFSVTYQSAVDESQPLFLRVKR